MKDYYALLGIEKDATKIEIRKNYRLLAAKYHPDKNNNPDSASKFILISEAYDVLSNKKSRTKYDSFVWEQLSRKDNYVDFIDVVLPPADSSRTRRNKAQQKRSLSYHQEKNPFNKQIRFVMECFYISARYTLKIVGISLAVVILYSMISKLPEYFGNALFQGILISVFIGLILYGILWILKSAYHNLKLDLEAFSVFYKASQKKATLTFLSVFTFILLLYILILKWIF